MKIKVIVKANANKSEILNFDEEKQAYRVTVKAVPEKGKANQEVIKLFKKKFKKPVSIVLGFTSNQKILEI